jgi:hypothetical protein
VFQNEVFRWRERRERGERGWEGGDGRGETGEERERWEGRDGRGERRWEGRERERDERRERRERRGSRSHLFDSVLSSAYSVLSLLVVENEASSLLVIIDKTRVRHEDKFLIIIGSEFWKNHSFISYEIIHKGGAHGSRVPQHRDLSGEVSGGGEGRGREAEWEGREAEWEGGREDGYLDWSRTKSKDFIACAFGVSIQID